jgi:hypothetical protein
MRHHTGTETHSVLYVLSRWTTPRTKTARGDLRVTFSMQQLEPLDQRLTFNGDVKYSDNEGKYRYAKLLDTVIERLHYSCRMYGISFEINCVSATQLRRRMKDAAKSAAECGSPCYKAGFHPKVSGCGI